MIKNFNILVFVLLCVSVIYYLWNDKKTERKLIRLLLHLGLILSIGILIFNPKINKFENSKNIILHTRALTNNDLNSIKDSLKITESYELTKFLKTEELKSDVRYHIIGNDISAELLSHFAEFNHEDYLFKKPNDIFDIKWDAILTEFQTQYITGKINVKTSGILKIKYGNHTLDSVKLKTGFQEYKLKFPVFQTGKNNLSLEFNDAKTEVHFWVNKYPILKILIDIPNPDFEIKTLSNWLAKQGHKVQLTAKISSNINTVSTLNAEQIITKPDLVICNFDNYEILKSKYKITQFLLLNLKNPLADISKINKMTKSNFSLKSKSIEAQKISENALFKTHAFNFITDNENKYITTKQNTTLSLYTETFPVLLSGDSITYNKIWTALFQSLKISPANEWNLNGPPTLNTNTEINLSSETKLNLNKPLENNQQYIYNQIFTKPNWQKLNDSIEVFIEPDESKIGDYSKRKNHNHFSRIKANNNNIASKTDLISDWIKFGLIILFLGLIWLEDKA